MIVLATYAGIELPPGEPVFISKWLFLSNIIVGDMEDLGLLFGATALASRVPSVGTYREKSVISLFRRKPAAHLCDPKALSIVAVIATAFPFPSTIER